MTISEEEQGSVTVLVVALVSVVVAVTGVVGEVAAVTLARHRASAAADLAALAAVGNGCGRAAVVARENDAAAVRCRPGPGGTAVVTVRVVPGGMAGRLVGAVEMSARAGTRP